MLRSAAFAGDEMLKFYLYPRKLRYGEGRQGSVFNVSRGFISLKQNGFVWQNPGIAVLLFPATSVGKMSKNPPRAEPAAPCPCQPSRPSSALGLFHFKLDFRCLKSSCQVGFAQAAPVRDGRNWGIFGLGPPYLCLNRFRDI